jgi:tryptophan-rich sensory protein
MREVVQSRSLQHGARLVAAPLRFVGFWVAIALPFLYLPLLFGGLDGQQALVFGLLLTVNALALVIGHGYRR